ncbi:unnamed protein product [Polarella glacialis]|uniref:Glycoside hydrolase family 5 domain-containing protein n=2 Tax=Polarella glacialis TaxID=89957 RepID=A0A813KBK9_POLGL|nr:unnamed protein product [Polarella glacialis]
MSWETPELVPHGVNVGGWFCLEDWFYSLHRGAKAGHCVATPPPSYDVASRTLSTECFVGDVRTIFPDLTEEEARKLPRCSFGCESDLVNLLLRSGLAEQRVVELFWRHRRSYIMPVDFARIRSLGIRRVRLPVTWCLSYDSPYTVRGQDCNGNDTSTVVRPGSSIVEDPFSNDPAFDPAHMGHPPDKWISIPIRVIENVLENAADFGIEVLIDIHAFPGASSAGTFNGVWPHNPRFWSAHREENFRTIVGQLLDWMDSLSYKNPRAFGALHGLTPMNEPAHLKGLFDPKGADVDVPYRAAYDLSGRSVWAAQLTTADVLATLELAVAEFRTRPALMKAGKKLIMNVIETAFNGTFGGSADAGAFAASQTGETDLVAELIGTWWRQATTSEERRLWAVLDIHNYISWHPDVSKFRNVKTIDEYQALLAAMSLPFFSKLRQRLGIPKPELLACSEYSASTDQDTFTSICSGVGPRPPSFPRDRFDWQVLRDRFMLAQHQAAGSASVDMWFWTYHIRKNVNYQGEWSLQHILSPWPRLCRRFEGAGAVRRGWVLVSGSYCCVAHLAAVAFRLLRAWSRAPLRGIWHQTFGLRFAFDSCGAVR